MRRLIWQQPVKFKNWPKTAYAFSVASVVTDDGLALCWSQSSR